MITMNQDFFFKFHTEFWFNLLATKFLSVSIVSSGRYNFRFCPCFYLESLAVFKERCQMVWGHMTSKVIGRGFKIILVAFRTLGRSVYVGIMNAIMLWTSHEDKHALKDRR